MPVSELLKSLPHEDQAKFLRLLQEMLAIPAFETRSALNQAGQLVVEAFGADKVDILLYDASSESLVAVGTSDTPMAHREKAIGMDRLPLANGGRVVEVYQTGQPYLHGQVDQDLVVLPGFREGLGIRSMVVVPLNVQNARRGCLSIASATPACFHEKQIPVIQAVTHWVGMVLHQAELVERIATDAAEKARQATAEDLITIMAHDLKNYMQPLSGGIELIHRRAQREGRDADVRSAQSVMDGLDRLRRVIHDLLDVSRLEVGLFSVEAELINLTDLAQRTATVLSTVECPIHIRAPEALYVHADPNRIRQAIDNLLANAQRYAPDGVPVVFEVYAVRKGDEEWAVVHVRDEGPGIPPELMPKLFTRYGADKGSVGLGLGLYLAHSIATAHGGTLSVNSAPGAGTSFCLELPCTKTADQ